MEGVNRNNISLNEGNKEELNKEVGSLGDKKVESPRSFDTKNISKENSLNNEGILSDITNRDISQTEINENEDLSNLLLDYEMSENPSQEKRQEAVEALIKYFHNADRLRETDFRDNTAFHWAAKLDSFEAWNAFRNILKNDNIDKEGESDPLTSRNTRGEGDTPWELVLQSQDHEFVGNVLLDEWSRNQNSSTIDILIKDYGSDIKKYTDYNNKEEFVFKYIEHRKLLAGDKQTIKKTITESHQTWKTEKENTATSIEVFFNSEEYTAHVSSYRKNTSKELQEAGYSQKILHKALSDKDYQIENNEILSNYLTDTRNEYQDWQDYKKNQIQEDLKIEYFMHTPRYLSIAQTVLSGGSSEGLNCLDKVSSRYSLKSLLQDPYVDQLQKEACIVSLFKQKDCHRVFKSLGYTPQEAIELAEKHVFSIAESGGLPNALSLLSYLLQNPSQITKLLSITEDNYGETPLHTAAENGHLPATLKALIDSGFSLKGITELLSIKDDNGNTPLNTAASNGNLPATLKALKDSGFSLKGITELLSIKDEDGNTPLNTAAWNGNLPATLKALKDSGFSKEDITKLLSIKNDNGNMPLNTAASNGNLPATLKALIDSGFSKEDITKLLSIKNDNGNTPLHSAASNSNLPAMLKALIDSGFSKEDITKLLSIKNDNGNTPLHAAAQQGRLPATLKALKESGFSKEVITELLSITGKDGSTPLHIAALYGNLPATLKALEDSGFSKEDITKLLSIKNDNGNTPLHSAAWNGRLPATLKALKDSGFSKEDITKLLSIKNDNGNTPLNTAAENGQLPALIKALIDSGFSKEDIMKLLSIKNDNGNTPLHEPAREGKLPAMIIALKDSGFSPEDIIKLLSITNKDGYTLLFGGEDNEDLIKTLEEVGLKKDDLKPLYLRWKGIEKSN